MKRIGFLVPMLVLVGAAVLGVALVGNTLAAARPAVPPIFGPNVRANSDATTFGQHEPSLAVSRVNTNTVVTAQKDYREGNVKHVWINVSTDGGATWPVGRQLQMPGVPAQFPIQSDAVVVARDDGRIYVACLATNNGLSNGAVLITWTDDNGATWRTPSVQLAATDPYLDDKNWLTIDNNPASPYYHRLYMMYAPNAAYVVEQHSNDGGLTWSARQTISASNTEYTYPVVGRDGTIYNFMMLNWGASQQGTLQLTKSTNGGVTWSAPTTVTTADQPDSPIRAGDQFRFFAIPSAAVDPNTTGANTALYLAWTDKRNFNSNGTDVLYIKSTNAGATWGPVTRLSHDPTGTQRDHITPMITMGADSKLHAFWLDRRLAASPTGLFDSWYSSSTDGGATWDADTRVSTVSQDLNAAFPPGSGNAAGDYWGLDTAGDAVYVAWTDTRSGNQDILVSKGLMDPMGGPSPTATAPLPSATRTVPPASATRTATTPPIPTATLPPTGTVPPSATQPPAPSATQPPAPSATVTAGASATATAGISATATASATVSPTPQCGPTWRVVPAPEVGGLVELAGASTDSVWAANGTALLHWDGTAWTPLQGPNGPGARDLVALGPQNLWAGTSHWDGTAWTSHPIPVPTLASGVTINSVAGVGTDMWAVGSWRFCCAEILYPLVEHWNGSAWSGTMPAAAPAPLGACVDNTEYEQVWAAGPGDAWASGYHFQSCPPASSSILDHFCSGSDCATTPLPISIGDFGGLSHSDVWLVGGSSVSEIAHWNGSTWTTLTTPNIGPLIHVSAQASNSVWAISQTGVLHWNGAAWSVSTTLVGGTLSDVVAVGHDNVWLVGANSSGQTLMMHYSDIPFFTDVPPTQPFYPYVQWMACRGYISGYTCGGPGEPCPGTYFRPGASVTRGQLLKMVTNAAAWTVVNPPDANRTFEDVPASNPFYAYVETGASHSIINGYSCGGPGEPCNPPTNRPYFRPYAQITRSQLSKVIALARGYALPAPATPTFEDVPATNVFYPYIEAMAANSIVSGYACGGPGEPCNPPGNRPYFRPFANATRGQVSKFVTVAYGGP